MAAATAAGGRQRGRLAGRQDRYRRSRVCTYATCRRQRTGRVCWRSSNVDIWWHQRKVFPMFAGLSRVVVHRLAGRRLGRPSLGNINDQCFLNRLSSRVKLVNHRAHGLLRTQYPLVTGMAIGALARRNPDKQIGGIVALPEGIGIFPEHLVPQVINQVVFRDGHQGGGCTRPFNPYLALHHLGIHCGVRTVKLPLVLRQQPVDQVLLRRWEEGLPPVKARTFRRSRGGGRQGEGRTDGIAGRRFSDGVEGGSQLAVGGVVYSGLLCFAAHGLHRGDVAVTGHRTQRRCGGGGGWKSWFNGRRPRCRRGGVGGWDRQEGLPFRLLRLWSTADAFFAFGDSV